MPRSTKKRCTRCGLLKPLPEFGIRRDRRDGRASDCRDCSSARHRKSRATRKAARKAAARPEYQPKTRVAKLPKAKITVVTWAQNATPAHRGFLAALKQYCASRDARLVIVPGRYRNPTSHWSTAEEHDQWYDEALEPFIFGGKLKLGSNLVAHCNIPIQPTTRNPLSGYEVLCGEASGILGSPQMCLETIASGHRVPRLLVSTGAVTLPNYTDSNLGKKGERGHEFGAVVAEQCAKGEYHVRQITACADGSFTDLDQRYSPEGMTKAKRAQVFAVGDWHNDQPGEALRQAYREQVRLLRPEIVVWHDFLDGRRCNPHEAKKRDAFATKLARSQGVADSCLREELDQAVEALDRETPADAFGIVVESNHHDFLDRWLHNADPLEDPTNAMLFHELWLLLLRDFNQRSAADMLGDHPKFRGAFALWYATHGKRKSPSPAAAPIRFLEFGESFKVDGVEYSFHGHRGVNGARPGQLTYAKLGTKTTTGHTHAPFRRAGHFACGHVSGQDHGYNGLPTTWLASSVIHHADGKRQHIHTLPSGRWQADRSTLAILR